MQLFSQQFIRKFLTFSSLCIVPLSMHAATLLSENFDELTTGLNVTSAGVFSTTGGTNIDIIGGANFGAECLAPESGNCVDLDGTDGNNPQGILLTTTPITVAAGTYYLSFDLVGNSFTAPTSTTVTFGSYSQTFVLGLADTTNGIVLDAPVTFASAGTASLTFTSNTPGDSGGILDNVRIADTLSTPEPTSALLLGSGLLLAGLIRKRTVTT
jgi:hypothetical protein